MASRIPTFCLCDSCGSVFGEKAEMFRWFEKNFCDAKCLTSYYKQNTTKCHECTVDMVFQTKFVLKTRSDLWIFCSDECFTRNTTVNVYCEFCSNQISNKSKVGGKNFCSADCTDKWLQSGSNQTVSCPDCGISSEDHKQINIHGAKHGLCGESCFSVIENGMRTEYVICTQCQMKLEKGDWGVFTIMENGHSKLFCSTICMNYYMVTNKKAVACAVCCTPGQYYRMIRGSFATAEKAWCSLECAKKKSGEGGLEMQAESNGESADSEVAVVRQKDNGTKSCANDASLSYRKIAPISKEETKQLLQERDEMMAQKCVACESDIGTVLYLSFHTMEFCGRNCLQQFFATNAAKCFSCDQKIAEKNFGEYTARIDNELCYFCSDACKERSTEELCIACGSTLDCRITHATGSGSIKNFCSECSGAEKGKKVSGKRRCTDCGQLNVPELNFQYNDKLYPYCSLTCFQFVRFSCGIYAEECLACKEYFICRKDKAFVVRRGEAAFVCSNLCMNRFIRKNSEFIKCSSCDTEDYDANMIQLIGDDQGVNIRKFFCSIPCLDEWVQEATTKECDEIGEDIIDGDDDAADDNIDDVGGGPTGYSIDDGSD